MTIGYGPSLSDQGYSPDDIEDPGPPHCTHCGAFLPWRAEKKLVWYGYPSHLTSEYRYVRVCGKCSEINEELY